MISTKLKSLVVDQKHELNQFPGTIALLNELFENSEIGYLYFEPDGTIRAINKSARKFLGCEAKPVIGKLVHKSDYFTDLNELHSFTSIVTTIRSGGKTISGERVVQREDGSKSIVKVRTVGIYDAGTLQGLLVIFWDITEPRNLEQLLGNSIANLKRQATQNPSQLGNVLDNLITLAVGKEQQLKDAEERNRQLESTLNELQQEFDDAKATLKYLMKQRDVEDREIKDAILANLKERVFPYIQKIRMTSEEVKTVTYTDIIATKLEEIVKPLLSTKLDRFLGFSATELQVIDLIQQGKSTKEIAQLLNLAVSTIKTHRLNIRKKLDIDGKKVNLRKQLLHLK